MNKPVIICVDDEKVVLTSLKEQLKRAFGKDYSVETAENGEDALDLYDELAEDEIDVPVIISDYIMPGMKGDELLQRIHTLAPKMLKILLTGQANTEGVTNAVNYANLYRYMAKPWEQEDIVLTVSEAIRSYFQDKQIKDQNEQLRASEAKYRSIFENAVEGMYQTTPDGRILSANPSMARILGYDSPEELLSSVSDLTKESYVNPKDREAFGRILSKEGQVIGFQVQQYRKDGSKVWLSLTSRCVRDTNGDILYYEGSLMDITEQREREKAERAREIAEAANKKMMESIHYAKMIQQSLLPNSEEVKTWLPDSFFIWKPRDIVGGDIFFTDFFEGSFVVAVIDCTGHGVPGAFMTMIASSALKRIIKDEQCRDPAEILKRLNFIVKTTLQQDTEHALSDNGLDAAICLVSLRETHFTSFELTFSGARLPLIYMHNNELKIIKGDRQSVGYRKSDLNFSFTTHTLNIEKEMSFYLATDGFVDQMGGERRRRFGSRRFRELIKEIAHFSFEEQQEILLRTFNDYKGDNERQDDVTVVGFGFK